MPSTSYVGIDPGASGGIAAQSFGTNKWIIAFKMPDTERDTWEEIKRLKTPDCKAVIEKVGGFIAGNPAPGSAMFNFGRGTGVLIGCLVAAGIPFEEVTPQVWQKGLGIPSRKPHTKTRQVKITKGKNKGKMRTEKYGGETTAKFKGRLKSHAQKLFPENEVTLKTCDALLISEFCRRKHEGLLK